MLDNPSGCAHAARKKLDTVKEAQLDRNVAGHFGRAAGGKTPDFSPDELAVMVERWRLAHVGELVNCRIPGTTILTKSACAAHRQGLRESCGDEMWECLGEICRDCVFGKGPVQSVRKNPSERMCGGSSTSVSVARKLADDLSLRDVSRHLKKSVNYVEGLIARGLLRATTRRCVDGRKDYVFVTRADFAAFKRNATV